MIINSNQITNLENNLTSSDTIYHQSLEIDKYYSENDVRDNENEKSSSSNLNYISNNPDVVIDINTLKTKDETPKYLNKSNSSVQINNLNIHDAEELQKDLVPKNEITIDIDNATRTATVTNDTEEEANRQQNTKEEEEKEKEEEEKNLRFVNDLYAKKFEELNSNLVFGMGPSNISGHGDRRANYSEDIRIGINDTFKSEDSLATSSNSGHLSKKTSVSYGYLNAIGKTNSYGNKLYNTNKDIMNTKELFENRKFLSKLGDKYNPQQRLSINFNHLYNPLFVSNNLSKRYDIELKHVDLTIKDIYEHGLPYLLRSKRPLIEFCKELIKECQIEILVKYFFFFIIIIKK